MGFAELFELIPGKVWLYAAIAVVLLAFGIHEYRNIEAKGAAKETAAVLVANTKADAAADAKIKKLTADYNTAIVNIGATYAKAMQSADTAHTSDLERLQQRAGSGQPSNSAVGSSTAGASAADARTLSTRSLGVVPAERALDLADALRADDAALVQCYADRDSLTGK